MNEATFFETRQFSPTSLTLIISLHAAALTAAIAWKIEVFPPDRPTRTKIFNVVPIKPPEAEKKATEPRPRQARVYIPPTPVPPQPERQLLSDTTQTLPPYVPPELDVPPIPRPPDPPPLLQSARARGDVRTLITADDYPDSARRREETGTVQARLDIGTDGKVTGCSVVRPSGSAALDSATCRVLKARARFSPARNNDGQAVSDSYVTPRIVWKIEGSG